MNTKVEDKKDDAKKVTAKQKQIDTALELLIHRAVINGIGSYEDFMNILDADQCLDMRQSYMKFKK